MSQTVSGAGNHYVEPNQVGVVMVGRKQKKIQHVKNALKNRQYNLQNNLRVNKSLHMERIDELKMISMLAAGATFKQTKKIKRYHDWYFGCKWTDAIIGQHPVDNNRNIQVRMFVPNWRVLGFPDLEIFVEEYNNGDWELIV